MKITKSKLKQLIKEELAALTELRTEEWWRDDEPAAEPEKEEMTCEEAKEHYASLKASAIRALEKPLATGGEWGVEAAEHYMTSMKEFAARWPDCIED